MDNTKLKEIGDAISDIRKHLGADCTPLKDLPGLVAELTSDSSKNGFSTIFLFSDIDNPNIPKCSTIDISTGIADLNEDPQWYQIKETFSENNVIFITWAVFDKFGQKITEWSKPVNIKGKDGKQGTQGLPGTDGKPGADGKDGIDGSTYEYIYFRGLVEEDKPSKPISDPNESDYYPKDVYPSKSDSSILLSWTDRAQGIDNIYKFEWRSERKKESSAKWSDFTEPILWAKYGEKGKDGDGVQYIFTTTTLFEKPKNPTPDDFETNASYQNNEAEEYIPKVDGQTWTDNPSEVNDEIPYCWFSIRRFRKGSWTAYTEPAIWSEHFVEVVTDNVILIDMDPDSVMISEEETTAKTCIRAYKGSETLKVQNIIVEGSGFSYDLEEMESKEWNITFKDINSEESTIYAKITVKISDDVVRYKTFRIYQVKFDIETVSVDLGDDHLLIPCSDGITPDSNFFPRTIPITMRVGGQEVRITEIKSKDSTFNKYEFNENLIINGVPDDKSGTIGFIVTGGEVSKVVYLNYTKFDTKNGNRPMFMLDINANDIVCDTTSGNNVYTVYAGKLGKPDNVIKANVLQYTGDGGMTKIEDLSILETYNYAVFYANDPQDWFEDIDSTINEYQKLSNEGIIIGETINPDQCVSFQLREWKGEGEAWSTTNEEDYIVLDHETILVDIIRPKASFQFNIDPNKIHLDKDGNITVPSSKKLNIGLSRNISGDNIINYSPLNTIPTGYDIYYKIDGGSTLYRFGKDNENVQLPYSIDVTNVKNSISFYLVIDENSFEDELVVLTETVEVTSDIPGPPGDKGEPGDKGDKGDQGEKGEDGVTPVIYKIVPSKSQIVRKNGIVESTEPIEFNVYKTIGSITSNITSGFSIGILNSPQSWWNGSAKTVNPSNVYSPITIYLCESGTNPGNKDSILAQCEIGYIEVADGADGKTYNHEYCVADTNDESKIRNDSTLEWRSEPNNSAMNNDVPYMWCKETLGGDPDTAKYYIAAMYGKGEPGRNAAIIYPAGVWDSEVKYVVTPEKVPYIWYEVESEEDKGYYKAKEVTEYTELMGDDKSPTTTDYWEKMDYMESIYSDIGVFNQALVGKWVFWKEYMFSQQGDGSKGDDTTYKDYDDIGSAIKNGINDDKTGVWFKPKTLMNAVTGDVILSGYLHVGDKISGSDIEDGTITAAQINTDALKVSRLATKNGNEGSIIIADNNITVCNIDSVDPILNITGSTGVDINSIPFTTSSYIEPTNKIIGESVNGYIYSAKVGEIFLRKGTYNLIWNTYGLNLKFSLLNPINYVTINGGLSLSTVNTLNTKYICSVNLDPYSDRGLTINIPGCTETVDVTEDTTYTIWLNIEFTYGDAHLHSITTTYRGSLFCRPTSSEKMIQISANGLMALSGENYFNLNINDGSFSVRTKEDSDTFNYMGMDKNGFWIAYNNTKYYDPYIATIDNKNVLAFRSSTDTGIIDL